MSGPRPTRFLTIPQVAEELATSEAQINALLKRGDLVAIKLGGRGQWRVERTKLEEFIARAYEETQRELEERRQGGDVDQDEPTQGYASDADYQQEEGGEA